MWQIRLPSQAVRSAIKKLYFLNQRQPVTFSIAIPKNFIITKQRYFVAMPNSAISIKCWKINCLIISAQKRENMCRPDEFFFQGFYYFGSIDYGRNFMMSCLNNIKMIINNYCSNLPMFNTEYHYTLVFIRPFQKYWLPFRILNKIISSNNIWCRQQGWRAFLALVLICPY